MLHIALHFLVPALIAGACYRPQWLRQYGVMLLALLIDADHLLANPIYDPARCSIGFHPLHSLLPIILYVALLLPPNTRVLGIGLCVHILLDLVDCVVNSGSLCFFSSSSD
ncbi:MAG: hypothetical protein EXR84_02425 [Gammaproteobacteria bacterium]|nr:hypothetical protein [Gammaproteobacteria bacterium]